MAVFDSLIDALNGNNFFFPVSVCIVVGAVLIFTIIKLLSKPDEREKASSFDVDDWDKEINGLSKKTKQKKVKATNSQADSGSNLARSKISGKQSAPAKAVTPPAKEKQAEGKPKASAKKQAASLVSSKSVQPSSDVQGEWVVAGSKKKQKSNNKKTGTNLQESKTKDQGDRETDEVEVVKTHKSTTDMTPKVVEQPHEALLDSLEREISFGAREPVQDSLTEASSQAEVVVNQPSRLSRHELPVGNQRERPLAVGNAAEPEVDEGNVEADPAGKETKSKSSKKKKKSKVVSELTQVTDPAAHLTAVTHSRQDNSSQRMENVPSSGVAEPDATLRVEIVRKSDSKLTKIGSKDVVAKEANIDVPDASKDVIKVATKSMGKVISKDVPDVSKDVIKVATKGMGKVASKDVSDASKEVVPDPSKVVVDDASKGVVNDVLTKIIPDASVNGSTAQLVVFDELGLKDGSEDVGQPMLKKKKKARKDN